MERDLSGNSSGIVRNGPRADIPHGKPVSDMRLPQLVSTVAAEPGEQGGTQQGRVRAPIVWGQGIPLRPPMAIWFDTQSGRTSELDVKSDHRCRSGCQYIECAILGDRHDRSSILSCSDSRIQRESWSLEGQRVVLRGALIADTFILFRVYKCKKKAILASLSHLMRLEVCLVTRT